ncbi:hypothetical protein [Nocardioides panacisoli]|uniref:Integral membrane protein n=1 Tax=Nocardioides panacisoli TaxID=627624 RepID=A0ABP7J1B8_9ACTN
MPELSSGWGRALVFVYGVFVVAATGRSSVQIAADFGRAPLAYALTAVAAVLYIVATGCLLKGGRTAWRVASFSVVVEAVGVLGVGVLSYARTDLFPDQTIWSHFGEGYGWVPLVLPFLGMAWLYRNRPLETKGDLP